MEKEEKRLRMLEIRENVEKELFRRVDIEKVEKAIRELTLNQKLTPRFSKEVAEYLIDKEMEDIKENIKKDVKDDVTLRETVEKTGKKELMFPTTRTKFQQKVRDNLRKLESRKIVKKEDWYRHRSVSERPRYVAKDVYTHTGKKFERRKLSI